MDEAAEARAQHTLTEEQEDPDGLPSAGHRVRLLRRSTTVSLFIGLGVLAGFLVDVLIVARFGLGTETDAFFGGYTLPYILVTRLAAIQPVLVTILSSQSGDNVARGRVPVVGARAASREQSSLLTLPTMTPNEAAAQNGRDETAFSVLLNAVGLVSLAVAVVGGLLARPLIAITTPGFDPITAARAATLARILFARVPVAALAEVCRAELYARRRFGLATLSNALPSLFTAALLMLVRTGAGSGAPIGSRLGTGIELVAYGMVLGAFLQVVLLFSVLVGPLGAPYRLSLCHPTPLLRKTGRLVIAPLGGLFLRQGVTLAERLLGSYLPAGSVTALSYANRLNLIVAGVFFDGITTASLPTLADRWSRGVGKAARAELVALLKLTAYVAIPVGLAVAALSSPLIRLFFERGQVAPQDAQLMGTVVGVYFLSLPFLGPFRAVQTFFYAIKEMRPVLFLHGGLAGLAVLLDLALVWSLGALGLALGYALSCGIIAFIALFWLTRRVSQMGGVPADRWRSLAESAWRLALTSVLAAAVLYGTSYWLDRLTVELGRWGLVLTMGASSLAGLAVFLGLGIALRLEAIAIVSAIVRKVAGKLRIRGEGRPRRAGVNAQSAEDQGER